MVATTLGGLGLCQLPTCLISEHLSSGALVTVLNDYAGATMTIYALWPRFRYHKPRQRTVVDALVAEAQHPTSVYHL